MDIEVTPDKSSVLVRLKENSSLWLDESSALTELLSRGMWVIRTDVIVFKKRK